VESLKIAVETLNALSPLGVIGLLAYIVYLLVAKRGPVKAISDNHLSGLPQMAATLARMEAILEDISDGVTILRERR
jgi:hypothetical protein